MANIFERATALRWWLAYQFGASAVQDLTSPDNGLRDECRDLNFVHRGMLQRKLFRGTTESYGSVNGTHHTSSIRNGFL